MGGDEESHSSDAVSDAGRQAEPEEEALASDIMTADSPLRACARSTRLDESPRRGNRVQHKKKEKAHRSKETAVVGDESQARGCYRWMKILTGRRVALLVVAAAVLKSIGGGTF